MPIETMHNLNFYKLSINLVRRSTHVSHHFALCFCSCLKPENHARIFFWHIELLKLNEAMWKPVVQSALLFSSGHFNQENWACLPPPPLTTRLPASLTSSLKHNILPMSSLVVVSTIVIPISTLYPWVPPDNGGGLFIGLYEVDASWIISNYLN